MSSPGYKQPPSPSPRGALHDNTYPMARDVICACARARVCVCECMGGLNRKAPHLPQLGSGGNVHVHVCVCGGGGYPIQFLSVTQCMPSCGLVWPITVTCWVGSPLPLKYAPSSGLLWPLEGI